MELNKSPSNCVPKEFESTETANTDEILCPICNKNMLKHKYYKCMEVMFLPEVNFDDGD